jgi:hypothetical protein
VSAEARAILCVFDFRIFQQLAVLDERIDEIGARPGIGPNSAFRRFAACTSPIIADQKSQRLR